MNGQFKTGDIPHNKGKKLKDYVSPEMIAKIKVSQFVEGIHTGENSLSWKGGIQKNTLDCVHVWTGTNKRGRRPVMVYEAKHGKLPANWVIYHLDLDKDNDDVENLIAVPRAILMKLNSGRMDSSFRNITQEVENYLTKKAL